MYLNIVSKNLDRILKIAKSYNPKIIAVTKYYGADRIKEAYEASLRDFGESRAIEAVEKINGLDEEIRRKSTYHFIGHLQTNKVKYVVGAFEYIHSVDSLKLAKEIARHAAEKNIVQKILIQVNNANEESKYGIAPSQLESLINEISKINSLELSGLMNIAPKTDEKELGRLFGEMRMLKDRFNLKELSMGMSNDFRIALEEGSTMIRLGHILFENS